MGPALLYAALLITFKTPKICGYKPWWLCVRLQGIIAYVYFSKCGNKIVQLRPSKSEEKTNKKKKKRKEKEKQTREKWWYQYLPIFHHFWCINF